MWIVGAPSELAIFEIRTSLTSEGEIVMKTSCAPRWAIVAKKADCNL